MENKNLVLKFEEEETLFSFENKAYQITNRKLVNTLKRTNIQNSESSLAILSLDNLPIYDVIQIKINIAETGSVLANFSKQKLDENTRIELIEKIKTLKDKIEPTEETQLEKLKKLISILSTFEPIYASFKNDGDIKILFSSIENEAFTFPFLVLEKPVREPKVKTPYVWKLPIIIRKINEKIKECWAFVVEKIKVLHQRHIEKKNSKPKKERKPTNNKLILKWNKFIDTQKEKAAFRKAARIERNANKPIKEKKPCKLIEKNKSIKFSKPPFHLFTLDYMFVTIFVFLGTYALLVGVFQVINKEQSSIFLLILATIFLGITFYSVYDTLYKRGKEKFKTLRYYLILFVIIGIGAGIGIGYLVSMLIIKVRIDEFSFDTFWSIVLPISIVAYLLTIPASRLINLIVVKIKKNRAK